MTLNLLLFIFLLLSLFYTNGLSIRDIPSYPKTSPFEFINHLKGCQKGNNTKQVHLLKHYLHKFGYLHNQNQAYLNNDEYDNILEAAVKTYQRNFHIKPTGIIDDETASKIIAPRCGTPDIINGRNFMQSRKHKNSSSDTSHLEPDYTFLDGSPTWPRKDLTYAFLPSMPFDAMAPVARAFNTWAYVSPSFTFTQIQNYFAADIVIGFAWGDHGDGDPFDGPGGTLAHAFPPTTGIFHYDGAEIWVIGAVANAYDLETIANHEIGHLLGLGHSADENAIMYPSISTGITKGLDDDDIYGLWALYLNKF